MPLCDWCLPGNKPEAVAQIPMSDREIKGGKRILVCQKHKKWAQDRCWYVETLEGTPIALDSLMRKIEEKHKRIRGTLELKYKPKDWPPSGQPVRRVPSGKR